MNTITKITVLVALLAIGLWGYRNLFPSDEAVIQSLINEAAIKASIQVDETGLSNYANVKWIVNRCTPDVTITLSVPSIATRTIEGRETLTQALAGIKTVRGSMQVDVIDINIVVEEDRSEAVAQFLAQISIDGADEISMEIKIGLKRVDGDWMFHEVAPLGSLQDSLRNR